MPFIELELGTGITLEIMNQARNTMLREEERGY